MWSFERKRALRIFYPDVGSVINTVVGPTIRMILVDHSYDCIGKDMTNCAVAQSGIKGFENFSAAVNSPLIKSAPSDSLVP